MDIHCKYDELVDPASLKAHPKNRNKHSKEQIDRLVSLYKYHGVRHPIIISNLSKTIVAGHGRQAAAIKAGIKKFPVVFQKFKSKDAEYAFLQADNAIALWAELDLDAIRLDLPELSEFFDVDNLGIKDFTVDGGEKQGECDDDEIPEKVTPRTKLGDIYTLGGHRLMCGDSTSVEAVEKLMNGEKADMVFTDPPYGINLNTNYAVTSRVVGKSYKPVLGDDQDFDPSIIFGIFDYCEEVFLWGADYYCQHIPKGGAWVVWDKKKDDLDESIGTGFELCWSKQPHKRMLARFLWSGFTAKERNETRVHPTQKPIALCIWFFDRWGKSGDNVVDLFGGSGSTLIACEKTNRKCFMMELDPHYCDVIVARWEKFTGKKVTLCSDRTVKTNGKRKKS
jgi:DNA modification methylase